MKSHAIGLLPAIGLAPRSAAPALSLRSLLTPLMRTSRPPKQPRDRSTLRSSSCVRRKRQREIDTIFDYSVEDTIVGGLKKLGLDPATIKYAMVSHGHIDHSGGAKYLQDRFGAGGALRVK